MLKVKAIWKVGYPSGKDKKIYSDGDVFKCDEKWGKRKAEQGKVEILEEIKAKKKRKPDKPLDLNTDMTKFTVKEAEKLIKKTEDTKVLEALKEQEEAQEEPRVTLISVLAERIAELEE